MKVYITDECLSKEAILDLQKQGVDICIIKDKVEINLTIDRLLGMGCPLYNKNLPQEFGEHLVRGIQSAEKDLDEAPCSVRCIDSKVGSEFQKQASSQHSIDAHSNHPAEP